MPSEALLQAALRRAAGSDVPSSTLGGAAVHRASGGMNPAGARELWQSFLRWFGGSDDESEAEKLQKQQDVDRAALQTMPDASGIPQTVDAIEKRRQLYRDIDRQIE